LVFRYWCVGLGVHRHLAVSGLENAMGSRLAVSRHPAVGTVFGCTIGLAAIAFGLFALG
jgi:hypothetical protein